jgi:hypothetical protein
MHGDLITRVVPEVTFAELRPTISHMMESDPPVMLLGLIDEFAWPAPLRPVAVTVPL